MCRKRPGPRCSDEGYKRYSKAVRNLKTVRGDFDDEQVQQLSAYEQRKIRNAEHRLEAAKRVFYATPRGQEHLREQIADNLAERTSLNRSRTREANQRRRKLTTLVASQEAALRDGIQRRADSYADYHMVEKNNERRQLREQAFARGGEMSAIAHPLRDPALIEARMQEVSDAPITLEDYPNEVYDRAASWTEAYAEPYDNPNAPSLPRTARIKGGDGTSVEIGEPVEGVPVKTVHLRINAPDGSVTEAAFHHYVCKNSRGKYTSVYRAASATSWEDASPIDVTQQELGHMLTDSASSRGDSIVMHGEYDTLHGAKVARGRYLHSLDAPRAAAMMGRDTMIARAGADANTPTQVRGIPVWHRYNEA